jgi:hypothetical protein
VREELIGIGALVVGVFLGLTLLGTQVTGSWGRGLGHELRMFFGAGAVLIPVMGLAWGAAAFERLGSLSALRAAALGAGLVVLVPYGIGVATGVHVDGLAPANYALWTPSHRLSGMLAGFLAGSLMSAIGTAGAALVGLFAFSALGIVTIGWHPGGGCAREKGSEGGRERPLKRKREITAAAEVSRTPKTMYPSLLPYLPPP